MVQAGRPLQEVKDYLGHKTLAVTLRYAHLAPENLRKAAASLDAVLPRGKAHRQRTSPSTVRSSRRRLRQLPEMLGEPCGTRTHDPLIKSQVLYRLS